MASHLSLKTRQSHPPLMPRTVPLDEMAEFWNKLSEPERAAFLDLAFAEGRSLAKWLDRIGTDGTVGDARERLQTFQESIAASHSLEGWYLGAFVYGQLGLATRYLEKFDDDTPMEDIPEEFEADIRGWCLELAEMLAN